MKVINRFCIILIGNKMKNCMKKVSISILAAIFLSNILVAQVKELRLEIQTQKDKYLKHESIYLNIYLKNMSNRKVNTNELFLHCGFLKILLKNGNGKLFENRQSVADCKQMTLFIEPDSSEYTWYNLTMVYGTGIWLPFPTRKFLEPDTYTVQATFETGAGVIYSNYLNFKIDEPQGQDRDAVVLLAKAVDLDVNNKSDEAIELLDSLKTKYPQTVYVPLVYLTQVDILARSLNNLKKSNEIAKSLIDKYPDTEYAISGLSHILTHGAAVGKDEKLRNEILEYVSKKYSGLKVGKYCKSKLRELQSLKLE